MDRKEFLQKCLALGAAACCLSPMALLEGCHPVAYATFTEAEGKLTVAKSNFADKTFVLLSHPRYQAPIYLAKINENEYTALLMLCTHRGCELKAQSTVLVCPCHGSEFSNTGAVLSPPATQNLTRFNVTPQGDNLFIQLK